MTVFKTYFKVLKKFLPLILMYVGICLGVTLLINGINGDSTSEFSATIPNVTIINNDDSDISKTFVEYVKEKSNIISISNDRTSFEDAIFERTVDAIIIIPSNFYNDLKNNLDPKLEIMTVPDSYRANYVEMNFNRFWTIAKTYHSIGYNEEKISEVVLNNLKTENVVKTLNKDTDKLSLVSFYFNYLNYGILAILIYGIGTIMIVFNEKKVKKRTLISSKSTSNINKSLYLGNACFSLIIWLLFAIIGYILYGDIILTNNGLLMLLNSFIFTISGLSISFLLTTFINKKEAVSGMVNIISLGSSFISGAFVPQSALSEGVVNMSKVLPSYWYIFNNNSIATLGNINSTNINPIINNMIIMLIYGFVFLIITLIINKVKLKKKNI